MSDGRNDGLGDASAGSSESTAARRSDERSLGAEGQGQGGGEKSLGVGGHGHAQGQGGDDAAADSKGEAKRGALSSFAIRRGVTTAMLALALAGFGLYSLLGLPLNRLPEVDLPVVAVVTTYTGASPVDIETLVTEPIERAVASVQGLESLESSSRQGASIVLAQFTWGTDMDQAEIDVRKNLELFADEFLPGDATRPLTFAFDPSLAPVVFLSIEGPLDGYQLREVASETVRPLLSRLPGVAAAEVMGGLDRQIHVELRTRQLQALGIAPAQVVDALRAANVVVPSGAVDDGTQRMNLQPTGLVDDLRDLETVPIAVRGSRQVLLRDVADVRDGFEEETHVVTADGSRAVMLAIRKQSDANTVQTAQAIREALPAIGERLPEGVSLTPLFDESRAILRSIQNLGLTALQAFALTGLVLLLFLGNLRTSVIAVVAVPTSILVAFAVMGAMGVTLNLISMAGLALAIGLIVDNGIVVLEATYQYREAGYGPFESARRGASEMSLPLFASTLTTVVVFLPILLVEGIAGELFRDLVLTITVTLLCSLLVALTLVPLMASRGRGKPKELRFLRPFSRALAGLGPRYERALAACLRHRKRLYGAAFAAFAGAIALVPLLGQDFLPKSDVSEIRVEVKAAPGTAVDEMRALVNEVETVARAGAPEARVITADYGASEGFAALFGATANEGTIRVKLPAPADRARSQQAIESDLAERFRRLPGIEARISSFSLGGGSGDVSVKLFGDDLDMLREEGERMRALLSEVEGVREARFSMVQGSPELQLDYDRQRMRLLGIAPAEVASATAIFFQGETATLFRDDGREYSVRVRAPRSERANLDRLRYLPIPLPTAAPGQLASARFVPLSAVAEVEDRLGPTDIDRENQRRFASVDLTAEGRDLGGLIARVERAIARANLPAAISPVIGGTAEDLRDAFFKLALALATALALVYMVMASQFESLFEPFIIMFTVPLGIIGVVLALALTGTTLQVTALVGVILLGGIVVNNGIVLIDVLKARQAEGRELVAATLDAGRTRLRPILMTALTTILGMMPLAIGIGDGAETWAPMARAVIGGMIVGTALTLFVIPALYVSLRSRRTNRAEVDRPRNGGVA